MFGFIFWPHHAACDGGSEFLNQGLNTSPLQWKLRVLTTGLPGKFPDACFKESCGALAFFSSLGSVQLLYLRNLVTWGVRVQQLIEPDIKGLIFLPLLFSPRLTISPIWPFDLKVKVSFKLCWFLLFLYLKATPPLLPSDQGNMQRRVITTQPK